MPINRAGEHILQKQIEKYVRKKDLSSENVKNLKEALRTEIKVKFSTRTCAFHLHGKIKPDLKNSHFTFQNGESKFPIIFPTGKILLINSSNDTTSELKTNYEIWLNATKIDAFPAEYKKSDSLQIVCRQSTEIDSNVWFQVILEFLYNY